MGRLNNIEFCEISTRTVTEVCDALIPGMIDQKWIKNTDVADRFDAPFISAFARDGELCIYFTSPKNPNHSVRLYIDTEFDKIICFVVEIDDGRTYKSQVNDVILDEDEFFQMSLLKNLLIPYEQYCKLYEFCDFFYEKLLNG